MGNLKGRLERLERLKRKQMGVAIIIVMPGETNEEAWEKYLADHPEAENAQRRMFFVMSPSTTNPEG